MLLPRNTKILLLRIRRKAKIINGSYKKITVIKDTSYDTYDISEMPLSKKYYKRKPQNIITGE